MTWHRGLTSPKCHRFMRFSPVIFTTSVLSAAMKRPASAIATMQASDFINDVNTKYEALHRSFEEQARMPILSRSPLMNALVCAARAADCARVASAHENFH